MSGQLKTCEGCRTNFYAPTSRARLCGACRTDRRRAASRKAMTDNRKPDKRTGRQRVHQPPEFIAIDGEGMVLTDQYGEQEHEYVLLGVGQNQYEWPDGLPSMETVFDILYKEYLAHPKAYFVGFFLTYDFNMMMRDVPFERIRYLFDPALVALRRRKDPHSPPFPVKYHGWEFDMLWGKRLKLRPENAETGWMYICDAGPFFQTSLLKALENRPRPSTISDDIVRTIERGKRRRSSATLDDEMRLYNRLENQALELMLTDLDEAMRHIGISLGKTQYHGPGQAAQKWLKSQPGLAASNEAVNQLPAEIFDPIAGSYYGGIFELLIHGHVKGQSYEYDINSAYPDIIAKLPCLCGQWERGIGTPSTPGTLTIYRGTGHGTCDHLGALPQRTPERAIRRPRVTSGWYWSHEIAAATHAGLCDRFDVEEYITYRGCEHPPPLAAVADLYRDRLEVGKETSMGIMLKLIYNSAYGKLAQSVGNPQVSNAVYAGLITAGCRTKILDAIATHPDGVNALIMIATDAVFFTSPHPGLPLSNRLGEWDLKIRDNLCTFKPGMYWDDKSRTAIRAGKTPSFKTRGVRARDFAHVLTVADEAFDHWQPGQTVRWPSVNITVEFSQISLRAAWARARLSQNPDMKYTYNAGAINDPFPVTHSADPTIKRDPTSLHYDGHYWRTNIYPGGEPSVEYDHRFGRPDDILEMDLNTEETTIDKLLADALYLR